MLKIRSFLGKNVIKLIVIALFIFFVYSVIRAGDSAYKEQEKNIKEKNTTEPVTISSSESKKIIKEFLENCTKGNYEKAYTYLSTDCKIENYRSFADFKNNFCEKNSLKGKDYSIEETSSKSKNTYRVELNNMLSTGKSNGKVQVFYCKMVIEDDEQIKISIER